MKTHDKNQAVLQRALEALQKTTGIAGQVTELGPYIAQGKRADAKVEIQANGQRYDYIAEVKRIDRFAFLAGIKNQLGQHTDQLLLVAPKVTTEMADKCRGFDLQFIDAAGNTYLRQQNLFILVKGQRPAEVNDFQMEDQEIKRVGNANNLRMALVLLCKPALLNAPYREIKDVAGIALGAVGWVFFDLNARGFTLGGQHKGDRVLIERQKLVQEWVTNYPIKLRPKLNPRKFRAPTKDWWKTADIARYQAQWGGEVAAQKLTDYLRPDAITIYIHANEETNGITKFIVDHKLRADPNGDIEIINAFWDFEDEEPLPETVPPILVYADLIATLDPRNLETAKLIYDQYITNTFTKA